MRRSGVRIPSSPPFHHWAILSGESGSGRPAASSSAWIWSRDPSDTAVVFLSAGAPCVSVVDACGSEASAHCTVYPEARQRWVGLPGHPAMRAHLRGVERIGLAPVRIVARLDDLRRKNADAPIARLPRFALPRQLAHLAVAAAAKPRSSHARDTRASIVCTQRERRTNLRAVSSKWVRQCPRSSVHPY